MKRNSNHSLDDWYGTQLPPSIGSHSVFRLPRQDYRQPLGFGVVNLSKKTSSKPAVAGVLVAVGVFGWYTQQYTKEPELTSQGEAGAKV